MVGVESELLFLMMLLRNDFKRVDMSVGYLDGVQEHRTI